MAHILLRMRTQDPFSLIMYLDTSSFCKSLMPTKYRVFDGDFLEIHFEIVLSIHSHNKKYFDFTRFSRFVFALLLLNDFKIG